MCPAGTREHVPAGSGSPRGLGLREALALWLCFGALVGLLYRGALEGPFVSDDIWYYLGNPYIQQLDAENLVAILDPWGPAADVTFNYAPVHLLLMAIQWQLFGDDPTGHHAVNVALHALNCVLLVALLLRSALPRGVALLGGLLFALHPANVEVVAWMTQLKSLAALALGFGAVLWLERHPARASALFGLALLTKFMAAAFLPMAAAFAWVRAAPRRRWGWLGLWAGLLALVAIPQLAAFGAGGGLDDPLLDPWVQLRSVVAYGAVYLWMAATGLGLSAFHEPPPASSLLDPRWLAGLGLGAVLAWRLLWTLAARREESAWWVAAAAGFVPVSQLASFRYPIADRYLYFILPGLIGALALLASTDGARWVTRRMGPSRAPALAALAASIALALGFGLHAAARVPLWQHGFNLFVDAARHYPDGSQAHYVRAVRHARRGDAERAVAELRAGEAKKQLSLVNAFPRDPYLAPIRHTPVFREFILDTARYRVERAERRGVAPGEQLQVALAYKALGRTEEAIALVEEFLRLRPDGRRRPVALALLEELRGGRAPRPPAEPQPGLAELLGVGEADPDHSR